MTDLVLKPSAYRGPAGPVVLAILDGVGLGPPDEGNAVHLARTPVLDHLFATCPWTRLLAHGTAVGLPSDADMGNSEVGHNAMGAGRVFDQGAKLVNEAIATGALFRGEVWRAIVDRAARPSRTLHLMGLLSDGNVHSHIDHLVALLRNAAEEGVLRARVHVLLDGRDVPETSALAYVDRLEAVLAELSTSGRHYAIASGGGRMTTTMDRYGADWAMVERGWATHVHGNGRTFPSARVAIETLRSEKPGLIDQYLPAFVIAGGDGKPIGPIANHDAVVFFNFRGDRAIEITRAFEDAELPFFDRSPRPDVLYAGMMQYDGDLKLPTRYLVAPPPIDDTIGERFAASGISTLAISETQKFGHVTYFWNGNRSGYIDEKRESYVCIDSDTRPFEERPWMKAAEITDHVVDQLATGRFRHVRLNYANGDMVGHTGVRDAAIVAVEAVDLQLGRLVAAVRRTNGILVVTADHGNADEMYERKKDGSFDVGPGGRPRAKTSHTLNVVPFVVFDPSGTRWAISDAVKKPGLANIASSLCTLTGFEPPAGYEPSILVAPG
ncbi:MAG: 2,3-bisphosphoglycerate-independent phosphoglycerate mutase [Deltaproteobacteria bacterium]|nr:2,3-bisphosphoglycerate-independent phosphoglycerate mutase [Deltaproteobacteria bacterium]